LFGAILGECVTFKVGWELYKSHMANEIEKFLEKFFFEDISSLLEERKQHSVYILEESELPLQ